MDAMRRLSIELSEELADIVAALVASGSYADASEVIQEALELFTRQDEPLEEWEEKEFAAAYDEWKANPSGGIPVEEVSSRIDGERALGRAKTYELIDICQFCGRFVRTLPQHL